MMIPDHLIGLLVTLVERIGLLVGLAFLATRSGRFRSLLQGGAGNRDLLLLSLILGGFGIIGTYMGVVVRPDGARWGQLAIGPLTQEDAIANSRAVSLVLAGLTGGPWTGLAAGAIAGLHRYSIGGFTALACTISSMAEGFLAGLIRQRYRQGVSPLSPRWSFQVTFAMEVLQMLIILAIARPFPTALELVKLIALPMILANSAGVAIFVGITRSILSDEASREGDAARTALQVADRTLPFLRKGLNRESALAAAQAIRNLTGLTAAAITDTEQILAHVGIASDHHAPGEPLRTKITKEALLHNRIFVGEGSAEIECAEPTCPLRGVVVVPLRENGRTVGTLKLYYDPAQSRAPRELAEGLAHLFSTQLALARAEEQARLVDKAEIRALQAQIQPHFLFNALNTVMALIRRDPQKAREVVGHLGDFMRQNLQSTQCETVSLRQELEHVRNYLAIEEARYGDRLSVSCEVAEAALTAMLPPLTLQPLVENAVVHGLKGIRQKGVITIKGGIAEQRTVITVADNGRGIMPERLAQLLERPVISQTGSGLALHNVHQRLQGLYGPSSGLRLHSVPGEGTVVTVLLPLPEGEKETDTDARADR